MARQNTQVIELDLRGGIQTDESPLVIGPHLLASTELAWQPYGFTDEQRRRILAFLPHRDLAGTLLTTDPFGPILTVLVLNPNGDFPAGGIVLLSNFTPGVDSCVLELMDETPFAIGETLITPQDFARSGWSVIWTGITKSTVYFGHQAFGSVYQLVAPGTTGPTPYKPTISPFAAASLPIDGTLDLTSVSAQTPITGETALPNDSWQLELVGTDTNGRETNISNASGPTSTTGKVLQFTVPDFTANYPHANLYAKKGAGPYILQKTNIQPGLYHLNGNGKSDPAADPVQSYKFSTSVFGFGPSGPSSSHDASLDFAATGVATRTPPEVNIPNGSYRLVVVSGTGQSTIVTLTPVNQVITLTTGAFSSAPNLYVSKNGGNFYLVNHGNHPSDPIVPLSPSTRYNVNGSGGMVGSHAGFLGIAYASAGPAPGGSIPSIIDSIVHLDRLWLLQAPGKGRSTAYFTDPLDPDTIRANNFVTIPADGTCLFRCNVGSVDPGAASHLLIGCSNCIWVVDGDPTTNSAVLRRLTFDVGIADKTCVAETSFGAVFLGTDGQFWLIPPGATQATPIGHRMLTADFQADFDSTPASLAWLSPYLVYCPSTLALFFADLSPLTAQGEPKWWGPANPGSLDPSTDPLIQNAPSLVRLFSATPEAGPTLSNSIFLATVVLTMAQLDVITRGTTGTLTGRTGSVKSGFLTVEDHKVELRRVVLETTVPAVDTTVSITAVNTKGVAVLTSRTIPGLASQADTPDPNLLAKTVFDFSSLPVATDGFMLFVAWPEATFPDLHRAWAEVRTQPKQDS